MLCKTWWIQSSFSSGLLPPSNSFTVKHFIKKEKYSHTKSLSIGNCSVAGGSDQRKFPPRILTEQFKWKQYKNKGNKSKEIIMIAYYLPCNYFISFREQILVPNPKTPDLFSISSCFYSCLCCGLHVSNNQNQNLDNRKAWFCGEDVHYPL